MATTINAITSAGGGLAVTGDSSGVLGFQSAGTTYMTMDTSGNFGIGTASPTGKLDVVSGAGASSIIRAYNSTGTYASGWANSLTAGYSGTTTNHPLVFATNDTERMRIDSSGNVGIGTSSPATRFQVGDSTVSSSNKITLGKTASTTQTTLPTVYCGNYLIAGDSPDLVLETGSTGGGLVVRTGNPAATTFVVNSSGNVGIGQTSPSSKLDVNAGSNYAALNLSSSSTSSTLLQFQNTTSGGPYWNIGLAGSDAGVGPRGSFIFRDSSATATRMVIDSSGNVLVNTASGTGSKFDVTQTVDSALTCAFFDARQATATNQYGFVTRLNGDPNNTTNYFMTCYGAANVRAQIRSNGGLANYSANNANLSDERLKTDITPAKSYLDTICSIPVVTFKYKDQLDEELNLGVIAQDVDKVAPELIDHSGFGEAPEGEDPYLAVYQTDLQYALMKCIQEQQAIIEQLKADVEALKGAK